MARNKDYEEDIEAKFEDDEEYDDYYDDSIAGELDRRAYRHRRRVQNQIIVICVTAVLGALIVVGCIIGVKKLTESLDGRRVQEAVEEQTDESLEEAEPIAVEAPAAE